MTVTSTICGKVKHHFFIKQTQTVVLTEAYFMNHNNYAMHSVNRWQPKRKCSVHFAFLLHYTHLYSTTFTCDEYTKHIKEKIQQCKVFCLVRCYIQTAFKERTPIKNV